MSDPSYIWVLQQQPVLGKKHQSSRGQVLNHVHGLGRQPADHNQTSSEVKGFNTMTIRGCTTQPLLRVCIQITHKQERDTHILSLHSSH